MDLFVGADGGFRVQGREPAPVQHREHVTGALLGRAAGGLVEGLDARHHHRRQRGQAREGARVWPALAARERQELEDADAQLLPAAAGGHVGVRRRQEVRQLLVGQRAQIVLEARLGAHFAQEPHIVRVYDFEQDRARNLFVLVMEYMAGGTLEERIQQAKEAGAPGLPVDEVVRTAYHAALGLAALHREGLVHRDIKPSNILYDEKGNAKIADLGVVQMPHGLTRRTELGDTAPRHPGTPEYMSPEQVTTTAYLPPASDIYSLGATLFEALTLQKYKHLRPGTRVSQLRPDVPGWLDELIARMLAEDPRARPWDGMELAREIEARIMAPGAAPPRPTDVYETAGPKARRPASGPSPDALLPTRTEEMPWASPVVRPRPRPHRRAASQAARQRQMLVLALLFIAVLGTCVGFAAVGWWLVRSDRAAPAPTVAPAQQTTLPAAPAGATSGPTRPQATTAPAAQQQAAPQPAAPSPTPVPIQTPVTSQHVVSTPPLQAVRLLLA